MQASSPYPMLAFIIDVIIFILVIRWLETMHIRRKIKLSLFWIFRILGCLGLLSLAIAFGYGAYMDKGEGRTAYALLTICCVGLIPVVLRKD